MLKKVSRELPEVNFSEEGPIRHLHLGSIWIQGSMLVDAPTELVHEYIQRMMAWLLLVDPARVGTMRAMQLGLGAGSLSKFCYKELRMAHTLAIEINPQVLIACRGWFNLPTDNARLKVVLADAAEEIMKPAYQGTIDALQVDLYDEEAAAPVLDSADFYANCRKLLTEEGCMTVNLFGHVSSYKGTVERLAAAFGLDALWAFKATREGNTVVLAQRTPSRPKRATLLARAEVIRGQWGLPADKWVRVFKPLQP